MRGRGDNDACRSAVWLAIAGTALLQASAACADATVSYHGYLYNQALTPIQGGFVIAGTFDPGFNPASYFAVYGDAFGNVAAGHYSAAVAAGTFRPVGLPVNTSASGFFSGSGTTTAAAGTSIYLVAFPEHPDLGGTFGVLGTGIDPTFRVPDAMGSTDIDAALANQFYWGRHVNGGVGVGTLPIPEPSTLGALIVGAAFRVVTGAKSRRSFS